MTQYHHNAYHIQDGEGNVLAEGTHAPGWVDVTAPEAGLTVAMRYPWQNFPNSWELYQDEGEPRLILHFYAPDTGSGPLHVIKGTAKTFQLVLWPHTDGAEPGVAAAACAEPILAVVAAEYIHATGALREIGVYDPLHLGHYEDRIERSLTGFLKNREDTEAYGFKNFGDGIHVGLGATDPHCLWISLQYDPAQGALLHYARSGDRRFFELGEQCGWHSADIDTIHCGPGKGDSRWYSPQDHNTDQTYSGHVVVEGMVTLYWLTGHPRLLEVVREVGDKWYEWSQRVEELYVHRGMERELGWPLIGVNAVYEATLDDKYLQPAKLLVDLGNCWQDEHRGLWSWRVGEYPKHWGGASFTGGLLMEGIGRFYELTGDEVARRCFLAGLKWMTAEMYRPDLGFIYKQAPEFARGNDAGGMSTLVIPNYALAYSLTGDRTYLDIGLDVFAQQTMIGNVLKMFGFGTRAMPRFVGSAVPAFDRLLPRIVTSDDRPATISLRKSEGVLRLVVRPVTGSGAVTLTAKAPGVEARTWQVSTDGAAAITLGDDDPPGIYSLSLSSEREMHWKIDRDLEDWAEQPLAIGLDGGVTLTAPADESGRRVYDLMLKAQPTAGPVAVAVRPAQAGDAVVVKLLDGRGRVIGKAEGRAGSGDVTLNANIDEVGNIGLCNLFVACQGPVRLSVNGFEPWASVTGAGWFNPDALPPAAVELKVSELNLPSPSYSDDLENLVHNGGFEEPLSDDGNPPHWRFFRHREEEGIGFTLDTEDRTEGQQSLKTHFPGATGAWRIEHTERIPARPGERFRLEATMRREGHQINNKRVQRYMREMGIFAICPGPNLSRRAQESQVFPYLLRGLEIAHPNQIWGIEITYIRLQGCWREAGMEYGLSQFRGSHPR